MLDWYIPRSQHWICFLKLASWTCLNESIHYINLWFFGELKHNNLVRSHQDITIPTTVTRCQLTCLSETYDPFLGDELTTTKSATNNNICMKWLGKGVDTCEVLCVYQLLVGIDVLAWSWILTSTWTCQEVDKLIVSGQINTIILCAYTWKKYQALPTCVTLQVTLTLRQQ